MQTDLFSWIKINAANALEKQACHYPHIPCLYCCCLDFKPSRMVLLDISMSHQASRSHAAKTLSGGAPQAGAEVFCSARRWRWRGDSFNWLLIAICKITWAKCEIAVRGLAPSDAGKVLIWPRPNYPLYQLGHFIFSTSVGTRWVSVRVNP